MSQPVNVDVKLGVNKYHVDETTPHIVLKSHPDLVELGKLIKACPAGLYKRTEDGTVIFDCAGCLECGTCRILCGQTILKTWTFPLGSTGVEFRYG